MSKVRARVESIRKTYDLNFEESLNSDNNLASDSNILANNSVDNDSNNQGTYCNNDDIKTYVHNITSKKLDWRFNDTKRL